LVVECSLEFAADATDIAVSNRSIDGHG